LKYHSQKMLTTLQISSEELTKLNYERYHYPCPLVQKRLHSIYIKAVSALSNEDVGNLTDAHRNSISEWIKLYQQGGIQALLKVNYGTNTSVLEQHASSIVEVLTKQPPRSVGEAMLKIQALTGIERSYSRVRAFMKRHDFSEGSCGRFLKSGHLPAKVNTTEQHKWVEETLQPVIKAAQNGATIREHRYKFSIRSV
jgi:transposase